jgi:hypothetical protein
MKKIMSFIARFFQEDNGSPSMMRLMMFMGVTTVMIILSVQVFCQIWFTHTRGTTSYSPDWNNGLTYIVFFIAGKLFQKPKEQKVDFVENPNAEVSK